MARRRNQNDANYMNDQFVNVLAATSSLETTEIHEARAVFDALDTGRQGRISAAKAEHAWSLLGLEATAGSIMVSRENFLQTLANTADNLGEEDDGEARRIFRMLDPHARGSVTPAQLAGFLRNSGVDASVAGATSLVEAVSYFADDERFTEEDFLHFMNHKYERRGGGGEEKAGGGDVDSEDDELFNS